MSEWLVAVILGAAVGLGLGVKIARDSDAEQPVRGGPAARLFHYLACAGLTGMPPFVLAGLVLGLPFLTLFSMALGFLAVTAACLLIYAAAEPDAPLPG